MITLREAYSGLPIYFEPASIRAIAPAPWTKGHGFDGKRLALLYVRDVPEPFLVSQSPEEVHALVVHDIHA